MATTLTYTIPNISCGHCLHTIQTEIGDLKGVLTVVGQADTKQVTITFEPPATPAQIETALAEINYPVQK